MHSRGRARLVQAASPPTLDVHHLRALGYAHHRNWLLRMLTMAMKLRLYSAHCVSIWCRKSRKSKAVRGRLCHGQRSGSKLSLRRNHLKQEL